jgi:hypothetical protein
VTRSASEVLADLAALATRQAALTAELAGALARMAYAPAQAPASDAPEYLTTREAAALLGVNAKALAALRTAGKGPRFVRVGHAVRYPRASLTLPE